jgi:quinol monooxygenase YgiN
MPLEEITLTGFIEIPAGDRARLLPLLVEHIRLTRAEPGCLAFHVTETEPGSGRFAVAERFRDRATFDAHQARSSASPWGLASRHLKRDYAVGTRPE